MKVITVESYGGPEVLKYSEAPTPATEPGFGLVKVEAIGVNFADCMMRTGRYPGGPQPAFVPGLEVSGIAVSGAHQGKRIMGIVERGGYAEYALVPDALAFPYPTELSAEQAAGFLVTYLTAYYALWMADLKPDEKLLIQAAAGGVGTAAAQLARQMGAEIFGITSSAEKAEWLRQSGLEHVIESSDYNYRDAVREQSGGDGIDIILESVGGATLAADLELLRPLGRLIVYGALSGDPGQLHLGQLFANSLSVHALHLRSLLQSPESVSMAMDELLEYARRKKVQPVIGAVYPLAEAAEAHRLLESRASYGKIILKP